MGSHAGKSEREHFDMSTEEREFNITYESDEEATKITEMLNSLGIIYEERNKVYGDNYKKFGHIMVAMFPNGLTIKSIRDFNRLGVFIQIVSKISRYAVKFPESSHGDSLDDLSVYSQMLRELDIL